MGKNQKKVNNEKLASLFFDYLKKEHNISQSQLEDLFVQKEAAVSIPLSILSIRKVGSFEAIVKYMRDNLNLSSKEISEYTGRSRSTVSVTYHKAKKKLTKSFSQKLIDSSKYSIPVSLFKSRKLSVLETIVSYLKDEHELSFRKIAHLLNRDDRTIWTAYDRARNKRRNNDR